LASLTISTPPSLRKCILGSRSYTCGYSRFKFDSLSNLEQFAFSYKQTDKLFNVADMNASDFAQEFIHSYGIPEMEPTQVGVDVGAIQLVPKDCWVYRSPNGYSVMIDVYKNLIVEK
jgi:hypothetical protein